MVAFVDGCTASIGFAAAPTCPWLCLPAAQVHAEHAAPAPLVHQPDQVPFMCAAAHARRDHGSAGGGVAGGLAHVALWNSAYLLSGDMAELLAARAARRQPAFSKL
jgi:hypothetical protein